MMVEEKENKEKTKEEEKKERQKKREKFLKYKRKVWQ
jgi:hypothetical protein